MRLRCEGRNVTVPLHDELDCGTLRHIITDAGLTVDEFVAAALIDPATPQSGSSGCPASR